MLPFISLLTVTTARTYASYNSEVSNSESEDPADVILADEY